MPLFNDSISILNKAASSDEKLLHLSDSISSASSSEKKLLM